MRLAKLDEDLTHKKLAISIKSKDGRKLISEGAVLSGRIIERLRESGLTAVYIEDDNYDILLQETLDNDKRAVVYNKLQDIYSKVEKNEFNSIDLLRFIRLYLLPEIKCEPVSIPADQVMDKDDMIQHSINVAILSIRTASVLGHNMEKIELMAFVSLMHDIGKLLKNRDVKLKEIPHYEVAYEFLKRKNCTVLTYMAVRFQEEFYNGSGKYKVDGQKQIDLAKILSICDFYETLLRTSNLMPYECFEETQALVNTRFDPNVFEAFRDSLYIYPVGLPVKLNNKDEGIIIRQNQSYPLRPVIKSLDKYYNLMENLSLFIEQVAI
ncbi:HD domain-containing protein [Mobilitalea sibirica]|uniref:HD domain-containing protein n=1 Tax=Mobilitalea sibirica TaxID=1462919 RepID=A0A8J7H848_9FIRM|nr:HD domain-containing protein [Mobilitalea sibirica]MBH1939980.1 HD domain-containing protein [Mobilitalea sibirica]